MLPVTATPVHLPGPKPWPPAASCSVEHAVDRGGDGSIDQVTTTQYDAFGYPIARQSDGEPSLLTTWEYNEPGQVLRQETRTISGAPFALGLYSYDNLNRIREFNHDSDYDGTRDFIQQFTYGVRSTTVLEEERDGHRSTTLYEYDVAGLHVSEERDFGLDGWDVRVTKKWEAGLLQTETNVVRSGHTFTFHYYYEGPLLVAMHLDSDGDGSVDTRWLMSYSQDGKRIRIEEWVGTFLESEIHHTYDEAGRLSRIASSGLDGREVSTFSYGCSSSE
jgi:hypothetical protein